MGGAIAEMVAPESVAARSVSFRGRLRAAEDSPCGGSRRPGPSDSDGEILGAKEMRLGMTFGL